MKSDFFAGSRNDAIPQAVPGAVNFRKLDFFPVSDITSCVGSAWLLKRLRTCVVVICQVGGTGMPTAEGLANVLKLFAESSGTTRADMRRSLQTAMQV